ncbi:MAG: hypothetical protein K0Q95_1370 [Bacteroidota bacterium]|jgi:hypothetical protein|nr:hypothetical protein [Bacteroidota bacterium]
MIKNSYSLFFLLFLFCFKSYSATFYSRSNGSWNTASTWSTSACGNSATTLIPGASDDVIICAGYTITMNGNPANCNKLTLSGTADWTSGFVINIGAGGFIMNAGSSITGSGGPNSGSINVAGNFTVNTGGTSTLQRGSLIVNGTTNIFGTFSITSTFGTKSFQDVNINGGTFTSAATETYTINGNVVLTNGTITGSSTGVFNIGGTLTVASGTSVLGAGTISVTGTTTLNGNLNENSANGTKTFSNIIINSGATWNNLSAETYAVSGTLTMNGGTITGTASGRYDVTGGFVVASGTNTLGNSLMNVTGPTTINSTLNITSVTGTKTFGDVTISSTGNWNSSVAEDFTINGNFTNNGSFTSNTGIYTFAGTGKTFGGTALSSFARLNNTGSYTNDGVVEVNTMHYGAGSFTQGTTGSYFHKMLSANFTVTTFNASAAGNVVTYNYAGVQNIRNPTNLLGYYHLTTAGTGIKTQLANTSVGGDLIISAASTLNLATFSLTVKGNFTNNGAFTPTTGVNIVTLSGTAMQTIGGAVITTFPNLTISNATGVGLALNTVISSNLNFTAGVITTGTNKVSMTALTGTVTGAGTSKFVNGFFEKNISAGAGVIRTFEIGNGTINYTPVTLNFASVSTGGTVTASVSNADHASVSASCIDELKSVNRVWTLTNSGTVFSTYSASCTFIGATTDADAGSVPANYYMSSYSGGVWTLLTRGTVSSTVNQGTAISILGDLQVGERRTPTIPVQPVGDTVCNNTSAVFSLTVNGVGLSYQWQQNTGSGFVNLANGGIYSGVTTSTLTVNPAVNSMNGYQYQCVISNICATALVTSNAATLTVTPNVTASVSISGSPAGAICAGTNVTFTAMPVNGGTIPAYQWQVNNVNTGSNSATFSSSTLSNADQVKCLLTSNAVCVQGSPATSNIVTMTVNPNLPVSVNIIASSTVICPGTSVTFTATPGNGGTTPSYQWLLNGSNVGSNSPSYSNAALVNGDIVTCVLTSSAVCPTGSPATSNAITITVNPLLPVSVSISASPSNIICAGTNVTFTASSVNGGASPTYQWQLNGVNTGTNSSTYSSSTLNTGDVVTCILTSGATCATGSPATSNSITMTVNPNMPLSVSISASPSNVICSGDNVLFTANVTNGGGYESYQWKLNGVNAGSNSLTFSISSLANNDVVTCVVSTSAQCVTGSPAISNSIVMTVSPVLPVSVSVSANPSNTVCAGTNVTFTASGTNGGSSPVYQWLLNGSNIATGTTYSNSSLASGDQVSCVLTSNVTCSSSNPATSNTITMTVNPNMPVSVSIASSAATSCSGSAVTFTATPVNGGTSPSYQWLRNGSNTGTNSATYISSTLTNGDIISVVLTSNVVCPTGNPATSNTITQTVTSGGSWLGAVSTDWNNTGNWCGGVPALTSDVTIAAGLPFAPVLTATSYCKNINIAAGTNLTLNGNLLNIYGSISGTGMFTGSNSSAINLAAGSGSGGTLYMDQSVAGTSNALAAITLDRSAASIVLGNTLAVTNSVTVTAGTLSSSGNLTLVSNASGTARISTLASGADVSGNVTAQRYIPAGTDGWMFLCSPVSGATLQQWDDDFITGGFPGSFYPPSPNPSIVTYDETVLGLYDSGYVAPSGITDAIAARKGYWAYIMGTPLTIDVTGPILKNNQTFSVSYTNDATQAASENGWNLVANPYPSTIDWDAAGWTKTNVNDAIYMYSADLDQYTSYVGGIGVNGGTNLIASSQAFLVQTSGGSPVLKLNETVKDATDEQFIRTPVSPDELIRLGLTGNGYTDETVIHFNSQATDGFDRSFDARKFLSFNTDVPAIGSMIDSVFSSVNTLPSISNELAIPVKVKVGVTGTYTIQLNNTSWMPSVSCLVLEDLKTGIQTDLRSTASYTFNISDTTVFPRFVIRVGKPIETVSNSATCTGNNNGSAWAVGNGTGPWDYTWEDQNGVPVQTHNGVSGPDSLISMSPGNYSVHISGNSGACSVLDAMVTIGAHDTLNVTVQVSNTGCLNTADGSIEVIDVAGGTAPYSYNWSNGTITPVDGALTPGVYALTVTDSTGCQYISEYIVNSDSHLSAEYYVSNDTVNLSDDEAVEFSNPDKEITSFSWNFGDGSAVNNSPNPSYLYALPGVYQTTLIVSDGVCVDTSAQTVVVETEVLSVGVQETVNDEYLNITINDEVAELYYQFNGVSVVDVEVMNVTGQKVVADKHLESGSGKLSYNLKGLGDGIYYFRITSGKDKVITKRVIKL